MKPQSVPATNPLHLLRASEGLIIHQALYAAAKLGLADMLAGGPRSSAELAQQLQVNEPALYRILRGLVSQGVFEETAPRTFGNNEPSGYLRTGVHGSVRSFLMFTGSEFFYRSFGEILYSIETGQPARARLFGKPWEYLREHPELARVFDDAMTELTALAAPSIAAAYDFDAWGSVMDVGGGNGLLLAAVLKAHLGLRGVLADQPHVLENARQRGFLGGDLEVRSLMHPCDFFREVPSGCRAYFMKNVIVDWSDQQAHTILANCRRAVPADGVLLLIEPVAGEGNLSPRVTFGDLAMLVVTGGKVRSVHEHRELMEGAGYRLNQVIPAAPDLSIIEAFPI